MILNPEANRIETSSDFYIYDEVIAFLATGPTQAEIIAYTPSDELQERFLYLQERNKEVEPLTDSEREELKAYLELTHFLIMLRATTKLKVRSK